MAFGCIGRTEHARTERRPRQPPGPGPDHRRCRRRPERHRDLLASGVAIRFRAGVDAVAHYAIDDRHPDALGAHRLCDRRGPGCEHGQGLPALARGPPGGASGCRQHHQHRRRHRRHGRGRQAVGRGPPCPLHRLIRCGFDRHADLVFLRAHGRYPEMAHDGALCLCGCRRGCARAVGPGIPGIRESVEPLSERRVAGNLRQHGRRGAWNHDQPVSVLLAGFARGRGQAPSA